jgi:hypothetical protein
MATGRRSRLLWAAPTQWTTCRPCGLAHTMLGNRLAGRCSPTPRPRPRGPAAPWSVSPAINVGTSFLCSIVGVSAISHLSCRARPGLSQGWAVDRRWIAPDGLPPAANHSANRRAKPG